MTDPIQAVAESLGALADLSDVGGISAVVAGAPCLSVPELAHEWATQARPVLSAEPPTAAVVDQVRGWLADHAPQWTILVRGEHATDLPGLTAYYVMRAHLLTEPADRVPSAPAGLEIGPAADAAEFLAVYGQDVAPLVTRHHLASAARHHLVARLGGAPVGCARVQTCALPDGRRAAHISGVAVLPQHRGQGIGAAISAAATGLARSRADLVWLHSTDRAEPIYRSLGFRYLTDHVQLVPR